MSLNQIVFGLNSTLSGRNIWKVETNRWICTNYDYAPSTGALRYASTIWRDPKFSGTSDAKRLLAEHEKTSLCRFEIRPVILTIPSNLDTDSLIREIRHQMCHGPGCKGPREPGSMPDTDSDARSDTSSYLSTDSTDYEVSPETYSLNTIINLRYFLNDGKETRQIFISLKGRSYNGDVLYGASIMRPHTNDYMPNEDEIDAHFKTAIERLNKCPVPMKVSDEHKHQLSRKPRCGHREDITIEIVDEIFKRRGGNLKVRGIRNTTLI